MSFIQSTEFGTFIMGWTLGCLFMTGLFIYHAEKARKR